MYPKDTPFLSGLVVLVGGVGSGIVLHFLSSSAALPLVPCALLSL